MQQLGMLQEEQPWPLVLLGQEPEQGKQPQAWGQKGCWLLVLVVLSSQLLELQQQGQETY
jgi:hypothetical protein